MKCPIFLPPSLLFFLPAHSPIDSNRSSDQPDCPLHAMPPSVHLQSQRRLENDAIKLRHHRRSHLFFCSARSVRTSCCASRSRAIFPAQRRNKDAKIEDREGCKAWVSVAASLFYPAVYLHLTEGVLLIKLMPPGKRKTAHSCKGSLESFTSAWKGRKGMVKISAIIT